MSSPVLRYPKTPTIQPVPLRTKANPKMLLENSEYSDSSSSSSSAGQCCASPPTYTDPVYESAANSAPAGTFDREQEPSPTAVDSFLQTLEIRSATSDCAQATAVAPRDQRIPDHWVLISLLCHRIFATFEDLGCICNMNTYFHQNFGPGETLVITARRVARSRLAWLEATITADNLLVATGTALYDGPRPKRSRETSTLMELNDLIPNLSELEASRDL